MNKNVSLAKLMPLLFGFFIMGFCDLVGVSVTYAQDQFGWSETRAGVLPSLVFFWFLVLSIPSALVMGRIGRKNTVLVSMGFTFIGMLLPFIRFDEIAFYVAFVLLGIGNTILQVSLNPLLTNVVDKSKLTSSLTAGQFIKAISSFAGPIVAGFASVYLGNWGLMFPIFAIVTLLSGMWLLLVPITEVKIENSGSSFFTILSLLGDKKILFLFLGILCVVGLDVGMNVLTPKILIERVGMVKESAGLGSSWYFAARTIGTAFGAFLLARVSEKWFFRINMLIATLAVIMLNFVFTYSAIIAFVSIIAFTSSSIFAVILSLAIQARPDKANDISGLMITGVAGGALFPFMMGLSADFIGNQTGSIIVLLLAVGYLLGSSLRKS